MIITLAARELRSLFVSPLAWAVLTVVQLILAYAFLLYLDYFVKLQPQLELQTTDLGITQIVVTPLLATTAIVLLIITPMVTMRLISEERRNQTMTLLLSAPLSMTELVLGKFLGALGFFLLILLLLLMMPFSLLLGTSLDFGILAGGCLALLLLISFFTALGLYISSLCNHPTVAAVSTSAVLVLLWIVDLAGGAGSQTQWLGYISMLQHIQPMLRGIINSNDIGYFVILSTAFLVLTVHRLNQQRLTHGWT
ncbi:MAG: ABC transporter permease subunit [Gammaproteobacteria bacterium]|nr:ABC transporter permease subunit [Gammaproteobacteria bacterium]MDH5800320.1 ABC transporter permease subunit [Gammaproteobacteria bacterium]